VGDVRFSAYPRAMIASVFAVLLGLFTTVGFVRSIRREPGARTTLVEWLLSSEMGVLVGVFGYVLTR
jgi:hypothetical protein